MVWIQAPRSPVNREESGSGCPFSSDFVAGCNHSMKAITSLNFKSAGTELEAVAPLSVEPSDDIGATGGTCLAFLAWVLGWTHRWYSRRTAMQCRHIGSSGREQLHFETKWPSFNRIVCS